MLTQKSEEDLRQFFRDDLYGLIVPETFEKSRGWIELSNRPGVIQYCKALGKEEAKYDQLFGC